VRPVNANANMNENANNTKGQTHRSVPTTPQIKQKEHPMKNTLFIALLVFALAGFSFADWQRQFGGSNTDIGYSVVQTNDGGYAIAGKTIETGETSSDVYVLKTDSLGIYSWGTTCGGGSNDIGYSIIQTTDSGYVIGGVYGNLFRLIRLDSSGSVVWTIGAAHTHSAFYSILQETGGYILAGYINWSGGDVYLVKRNNSTGHEIWHYSFGGTAYDEGRSIQKTLDGGYIIAGYTSSFGSGEQVYLIKTDPEGSPIWTRAYGGTNDDRGYSVLETPDGCYIIAGYTNSFGAGSYDFYLLKIAVWGDTLWTRTFGGSGADSAFSVVQAPDGGFVIAGFTSSFGAGGSDVYLVKTNSEGYMMWDTTFGGTGNDGAYSIAATADGGYIITGYTCSFGSGNEDIYLIKIDSIPDVNTPPVFTICPNDTTIFQSETLVANFLAIDLDGDVIEYSLIDAPHGASIAGSEFSFTTSDTGIFDIIITACDGYSGCDTCEFQVTVEHTNTPPEFVVCPDDTAICLGDTFMAFVAAEDADGDTIFYFIADAPSGASFEYPVLTFIPSDTGNFFFSITACDPFDACDTCDFYVAVDSCDTDAVLEKPIKPNAFFLDVQPNPFNSSITIAAPAGAEIEIYDLLGNRLWSKTIPRSAPANLVWKPEESIASGVYIVRAATGNRSATKRVVYLK